MRRLTVACVLLVLMAVHVEAGSLEKAYFAATDPGTWATHESRWEMPDGTAGTNIYTSIRAADSADHVRIEFATETLEGPGEGMISRQLFIMEPGFNLARDYLGRMKFLVASVSQAGGGPPSLMPGNVIEIMRESAGDPTNSVTFKGRTTSGGRECDLYAYSYTSGGPHPTLREGEICLEETLPFGVVFQTGRIKDMDGNLVSSFEEKVIESGAGKSGTEALLAMTPEAAPATSAENIPTAHPSLSLLEAYQSGKIRLLVEVVEGTGGRRLNLTALNTTEDAFDLVIPGGPVALPADSPLGTLRLVVDQEQRCSLAPGGSSQSVAAGQPGDRGAAAGKFQMIVYEGQPLFQGSVDVGPLE